MSSVQSLEQCSESYAVYTHLYYYTHVCLCQSLGLSVPMLCHNCNLAPSSGNNVFLHPNMLFTLHSSTQDFVHMSLCTFVFFTEAKSAPGACFEFVNFKGDRFGNCGYHDKGYRKCETRSEYKTTLTLAHIPI